jgi:hypothetical protein
MRRGGALCRLGMLVRFSPDSARAKIPIAMMAVTQKTNRAAIDIFIRVSFLYAPAIGFVPLKRS